MSNITGNPLLFSGYSPYIIDRSLRFNSADTANLSRTLGTPTSSIWTLAFWVKRSALGSIQPILGVDTNNYVGFDSNDYVIATLGGLSLILSLSRIRDTSAWYHIAILNNGISGQMVCFLNGISQGVVIGNITTLNTAVLHRIGSNGTNYFSGYLADVHFIDGDFVPASSFTYLDPNSVLQPKRYTGTYGNNGFRLDFSDNSNTTSTTLGKDRSGRNNDWTPNNFSVAAGVGNDSLVDSPTNGISFNNDTGGIIRGNYATWQGNVNGSTTTNGNLDVTNSTGRCTFKLSDVDRFYFEITGTGGVGPTVGFLNESNGVSTGVVMGANTTYGFEVIGNGAGAGGTIYSRDITGGGSWSTVTTLGTAALSSYRILTVSTSVGITASLNAGQRPFLGTPQTVGAKGLCSTNLRRNISRGYQYNDIVTYTGDNAASRNITGFAFSPDFVWIKSRALTLGSGLDHKLFDIVRGSGSALSSNTSGSALSQPTSLLSFNSDGFTIGSLQEINYTSVTYAAWAWDESPQAGFDLIEYTGTGSTRAVNHSLGAVPTFIIVKRRDNPNLWAVYHAVVGTTAYLSLSQTSTSTSDSSVFGVISYTNTSFFVGSSPLTNASGGSYIAYVFSPVAGYSFFGSYTGNGNADGPVVILDFEPSIILIKGLAATDWLIFDYKREGYNVDNDALFPNIGAAEPTTDYLDITSNGFKIRTTNGSANTNATTYVYAAFAYNPLSVARGR